VQAGGFWYHFAVRDHMTKYFEKVQESPSIPPPHQPKYQATKEGKKKVHKKLHTLKKTEFVEVL
jgi:hypothetical protein